MFKLNPITGLLDLVNESSSGDLSGYYKLDGSNTNGYFYFSANSYFRLNGNTLELWLNGTMVQTWTVTPLPPPTPPAGYYIGFGGLTYS